MTVNFHWRVPPSALSRAVEKYGDKVYVAINVIVGRFATELQNDARSMAPWQDRTGNARSGLFSLVRQMSREVVIIYLSHGHTIEYGVFLELAGGGKYAIIMPTFQRLLPDLRHDLTAIFGGGGWR